MKHFIIITLLFVLYVSISEAQTNVNIAGPENVLVVYRAPVDASDTVSQAIMQYYKDARGIPAINIVELNLDREDITIDDVTHPVIIAQETDIIRDSINHEIGTWYATEHAWKYYYDYVAAPIKEHLVNNNLTNTIRYVVLCKGVPFKIQAGADSGSVICNVTVDGLLCMLNTSNYEDFLHDLYTEFRSFAVNETTYCYSCTRQITNPYFSGTYGIDPSYTFNYRFAPGYFTRSWEGYTVKLDYLVSHLDGISYEVVKSIIDRSIDPDMSGDAFWVLDHDPGLNSYQYLFSNTKDRLESFGFNVEYDNSNSWITSHPEKVIGFSSWGTHAENGNCAFDDSAWVKDSLDFNLANGAIFNSYESFNGTSLSTLVWKWLDPNYPPGNPACNHTQGLATQWTEIGGTGFTAHAWEPFLDGAKDIRKTFNTYAMGYNMVDAFYQGLNYLAWVNVVVGDPLTTIAWGKQELADDITWEGTNLVTGEITVPLDYAITLEDNAVVNFKYDGFITGDGFVLTETRDFTLNISDWEKSLFRSAEDNHPKLIWGEYPYAPQLVDAYNIYRKWESTGFEIIEQVDASTFEYIDEDVEIYVPTGETPKEAEYYITAILQEDPNPTESIHSNTIDYWVNKAGKISVANTEIEMEYFLAQNYPNPFNPSTTIRYNLKEDGLVSIKVYNILGSEVAQIVNEQKSAGEFSSTFDFSNLASGTYFYVLRANDFVDVKKMVLLK